MGVIDKVQATIEKLTNDDTRLTSAEVTLVQQAYVLAQLGHVKGHLFQRQVQDPEIRSALEEVHEEFVRPHVDRPRRILEKAGIPFVDLQVEERARALADAGSAGASHLTDREILLDTMYWLQASVTAAQAGALASLRGDVRDYFLGVRESGMDQWRKLALVVYRKVPNAIPPTVGGAAAR